MLNFAWWWVFFALPLPIIVRLLSKKTHESPMAALRVPSLRPGEVSEQTQLKQTKTPLIISSLIWLLLISAAARPQLGLPSPCHPQCCRQRTAGFQLPSPPGAAELARPLCRRSRPDRERRDYGSSPSEKIHEGDDDGCRGGGRPPPTVLIGEAFRRSSGRRPQAVPARGQGRTSGL